MDIPACRSLVANWNITMKRALIWASIKIPLRRPIHLALPKICKDTLFSFISTVRDVWNLKYGCFFGKIPNSLWPPPLPIFGNFIALFFAKNCKYAFTRVNLQWYFLYWRWPPLPPFWTFFRCSLPKARTENEKIMGDHGRSMGGHVRSVGVMGGQWGVLGGQWVVLGGQWVVLGGQWKVKGGSQQVTRRLLKVARQGFQAGIQQWWRDFWRGKQGRER